MKIANFSCILRQNLAPFGGLGQNFISIGYFIWKNIENSHMLWYLSLGRRLFKRRSKDRTIVRKDINVRKL